MKTLRFWLLLLLVALLPLRGGFAAAMLCGPAGGMSPVPMVKATEHGSSLKQPTHDHRSHDHAASDHQAGADPSAPDPVDTAGHEAASQPGHDKCNMCSAFCSAAPLLTEMPTVTAPIEFAHVTFDKLSASAPSFISGGPERPPRSI